ncbi:PREDICTED: FIP1[III]-like protein [Nelumbo nucifera]|uniref:FIP1[III]-like protein n=2 Tax=Nelumbo nucifera TaxID=4432 RepID=A0A1U8AXA6_NELNU|nr:PREDICTED: FIP1[III]-like protein [Nelumbo nucifera]DAD33105.1 TPA_asm: hypothetical protein HUJ06_011956 [Nelumbo nucifera]
MGEMDDDFGDLYADVEVQVSAAMKTNSSFNHLYIEKESEDDGDGVREGHTFDSSSKKVDSVREELVLHCDNTDAKQENGNHSAKILNTSFLEANGGKELTLDNGSDSEDDLHIVLNEEDCRTYPTIRSVNMGNRRMAEASDDEDDDLVIVTEANRSSKDRKWVDQVQLSTDGVEQVLSSSGAERANAMKGGYLSQYSQYKYVRSHVAAPLNSKASGYGGTVSLSSPLLSRGDLDASNQHMGSGSGPITSCITAVPSVTSRGRDFSLPWYRTILDVNIEMFERKPWRQPGVDITDFFNFGLDEENWKDYCNRLEQFRQKAAILTRPNRSHQDETENRPEVVAGESSQILDGEGISLPLKNTDGAVRLLEMPKGRAIQVEGGIGERRPSIDVRRPRNRDSDVVIEIAVQDSLEDSFGSDKEKPGNIDNSVPELSDNVDSGRDNSRYIEDEQFVESVDGDSRRFNARSAKHTGQCSLTRCSQPKAASTALFLDLDCQGTEHIHDVDKKAKEHISEETESVGTVIHSKEGVDKSPSKAEPCILEPESSLGEQDQPGLSPSHLDSHSESSKTALGMDLNEIKKSKRGKSSLAKLRRSVKSDYDRTKDLESNSSKTESGNWKYSSRSQSPIEDEQTLCSRMRLRSVAELKIHPDHEVAPLIDREDQYSRDCVKVSHRERKDWVRYNGSYYENSSYYRETGTENAYHHGRLAEKQGRHDYTEVYHRKGHQHFRDEMDPYFRRHWYEKEHFVERFTAEYRKIKQKERYFQEREYTDEEINSLPYNECAWSPGGHSSFYKNKERHTLRPRKGDDEWLLRKRVEDDELMHEDRYKEEIIHEKYGRYASYDGRREAFEELHESHIPYGGRGIKISRRSERYIDSPCSDMDDSLRYARHDDEYWRCPDHHSLSSHGHRQFPTLNGRGWRGTDSPRDDVYHSRNSDERCDGHWRNMHSEKHWFNSICKDSSDANYVADYTDDETCNERRRRINGQFKALHWDEDEPSYRHRGQDNIYVEEMSLYYEKNSRHEPVRVRHEPTHHEMIIDDYHLEQVRAKMTREDRNCGLNNGFSCSFDTHRGKRGQAVLRCRDSVDLHVIGWEGKSSVRHSKAGDARHKIGHDNRDQMVGKGQTVFRNSTEPDMVKTIPTYNSRAEIGNLHGISSKIERLGPCDSKLSRDHNSGNWLDDPLVLDHDDLSLEEGQVVVEPVKKVEHMERKNFSNNATQKGDMKECRSYTTDAANENKSVGGYDNHRILETIAKMERRRERFKEAIPLNKEVAQVGKNSKPEPDPVVETTEVKQQRPARKRRWCGS